MKRLEDKLIEEKEKLSENERERRKLIPTDTSEKKNKWNALFMESKLLAKGIYKLKKELEEQRKNF